MGSLRQPHAGGRTTILETSNVVDPWPRRVDDGSGGDRQALSRDAVDDVGTGDASRRDPEILDARVVDPHGAHRLRGPERGEHEPCVIGLMVVVRDVGSPGIVGEPGRQPVRLGGLDAPGAAVPEPRESSVGEHAEANLRRAMRSVCPDRQDELEWAHEVRRHQAGIPAALSMGLANELDVAEPEVPQASVDELRGGARRRACRIASVDERDARAGTRGRPGRRGADRTAPDHEHVERLGGEPFEPLGAGLALRSPTSIRSEPGIEGHGSSSDVMRRRYRRRRSAGDRRVRRGPTRSRTLLRCAT